MEHRHQKNKVRLSVDCTEEQRMYIKMLAAKHHMTISEYLLSLASREMPKCTRSHEPNEETIRALKESREEGGDTYESLSDFWRSVGINPNADD
jgi:hypothetical protein